MSTSRESTEFTTLDSRDGLGAIAVHSQAYQQFELAVERGLEQLVSRWLPLAAPHDPLSGTRSSSHHDGPLV